MTNRDGLIRRIDLGRAGTRALSRAESAVRSGKRVVFRHINLDSKARLTGLRPSFFSFLDPSLRRADSTDSYCRSHRMINERERERKKRKIK